MNDANKIRVAIEIIMEWGVYDGGHHKQYTLDQALRVLLGGRYNEFIDNFNSDEYYENWNIGIAP